MDELEKRVAEEARRHQELSDWIAKWVIDPLIAGIAILGLFYAMNSPSLQKSSPQITNSQLDLDSYQPQKHTYQAETSNPEYFLDRPQI